MGFLNILGKITGSIPLGSKCKKCKEVLSNCEYTYTEQKRVPVPNKTNVSNVYYSVYVTCPKCGQLNVITEIIQVADNEVEGTKIKDWLIKKFGK